MRALVLCLLVGCYVAPAGAPAASPSSGEPGPATTTPPPPPPTTLPYTSTATAETAGEPCVRDADCVVTNWAGCCACPQCSKAGPSATSVAALASDQAACKTMRCNMSSCDIGGMCPPGEDASAFVPRCDAGRCVGERR